MIEPTLTNGPYPSRFMGRYARAFILDGFLSRPQSIGGDHFEYSALQSEGWLSQNALSDYAEHHVIEAIKRIRGVSDARIFELWRYAMRVWLDAKRLEI